MPKEIDGIDIGSPGDSRAPVLEAFAQKGVKVSSGHIPNLRAGRVSGDILEKRVACASLLSGGSPIKKDELYEKIAKTATSPDIRLPQVHFPHRYNSNGFTSRLSENIGLPVILVDEILRAMRVEVVMSDTKGILSNYLLIGFHTTVNNFLNNYEDPYAVKKSPSLQRLFVLRNSTIFTPDIFYRAIYEKPSNRFIGTWVTQEVDWFAQFYALRLQPPYVFSPFDSEVLREAAQGRQGLLPEKFSKQTGILVNRWVIETHTNALLGQILVKD